MKKKRKCYCCLEEKDAKEVIITLPAKIPYCIKCMEINDFILKNPDKIYS